MNHPCWLGFLRLGLALVCLFGWDVAHVLSFHSPQAAVTSCRFAEITSEALPEEIRGVAANSARSRGGNLPYRRTARDRSVTSLRLKSWWDDDLPNILGINPIEAAIIFGALYYFYGPDVLYEYAREAGKLFSTYAPVVKDVSLDLYNEFRDYLEENRERELLRKAGVDIDKIPRKTTNALERFQAGLETFSALTGSKSDSSLLESVYRPTKAMEDSTDPVTEAIGDVVDNRTKTALGVAGAAAVAEETRRLRRSKKEVLAERNVDIDKVMEATSGSLTNKLTIGGQNIAPLVEAPVDSDLLNDDKYRFPSEAWEDTKKDKSVEDLPNPSNLLGKTGQNNLMGNYSDYGVPLFDDATENSSFGEYPSLSNSASELVAEFPTSPVNPSTAVSSQTVEVPNGIAQSISLSRFQQQMSGEWNQRVLRKERYTEPVEATPSTGSLAKYEAPESVQSDIAPPATKFQRQIGGQLNRQVLQQSDEFPFAEQGMAPVTDNEIMPDFLEFTGTRNLTRASAIASGKASKLGASTLFSQNGSGSIPEELSVNDSASLEVTESNLGQVLAEIDQDYMALRAKLVRIIESREKFASKPVVGSTDQIEAKEPYMSSYSQSVNDSQ